MSKNSNADLHILNDPEIPSMIQTIGRVKKVMLRVKEHAATCSCCRDVMMNDDQCKNMSRITKRHHQHNFEAVGSDFEFVVFRCNECGYEFEDLCEPYDYDEEYDD
ncbi:MAG: hypothetical protein ACRD8W_29625 [Nitrososphaeraceae archaeon]